MLLKRKQLAFLLVLSSATLTGWTQRTLPKDLFAFSWEVAIPSSDKYLSETSFSGWRAEYRKWIRPDFSAGIGVSWNAFDKYVNSKTYTSNNGSKAVTTDMIRQIYTFPITLVAHYYPQVNTKAFRPYLGVGLGAQYAEINSYFNIYEMQEKTWGFVARPEIGTLIRLGDGSPVSGLLSFGANIATNKSEAFNINSLTHFVVNVGLSIRN